MPIASGSIYPVTETVLNRARVLINDAYNGGAGRVLTDIAPFTNQYLNLAINRVQFDLANEGVPSFWRDNLILTPISAVSPPDPDTYIFVSYQGSNFGNGSVASPTLPNDLIIPWDLWEQPVAGSVPFKIMHHVQKLPSRFQVAYSRQWTWEGDVIKSPGATQDTSWRLRYEAVIPEVAAPSPTVTLGQAQIYYTGITIPIRMGTEALAQRIAYFYEVARGDAELIDRRDADAQKEVDKLIQANARASQRQAVRRRGFRHGRDISQGMFGIIS
jgi:hypothetical protein